MAQYGVPALFLSLCLTFLIISDCSSSKEKFFTEVPLELRCPGCELTVKILNRMLEHVDNNTLETQVNKALDVACDEKRFSISEYKAEVMIKVCEFMKEKHGNELKSELMSYFDSPKRPTYLEFVQHVCLHVMRLCAGVSHKVPEKEDTVLHFDSKSHEFTVLHGRNVRIAKPVHESHHDEL